mmetsp:Transcript_25701/g.70706  ORF Transcript_25701/g.70706 Transcript_25701/m.70706 type:complete len:279 (+) Transcript_25701:964-1800(+)
MAWYCPRSTSASMRCRMSCRFSSASASVSLPLSFSLSLLLQLSILDCKSSRCCCACAINLRCSSTNTALRSRNNRPLTEPGTKSYRRMLPSRTSVPAAGAQSPSVRFRPDAPFRTRAAPSSLASGMVAVALVSMSPSPVQSKKSMYLGSPSLVSWSPAAARSHPVSRTAILTPRPSAVGWPCRRSSTLVSSLGMARLEEKAVEEVEVVSLMVLWMALALALALALAVSARCGLADWRKKSGVTNAVDLVWNANDTIQDDNARDEWYRISNYTVTNRKP